MISIKIHRSYRIVVAVCDAELLGKKFEEGIKQLDVRENFFKDQEMEEEKAIDLMKFQLREDATFNIIGEKSINAAIKAEVISPDAIAKVAGIPFALKLL
jgi:uncharacterized protein